VRSHFSVLNVTVLFVEFRYATVSRWLDCPARFLYFVHNILKPVLIKLYLHEFLVVYSLRSILSLINTTKQATEFKKFVRITKIVKSGTGRTKKLTSSHGRPLRVEQRFIGSILELERLPQDARVLTSLDEKSFSGNSRRSNGPSNTDGTLFL